MFWYLSHAINLMLNHMPNITWWHQAVEMPSLLLVLYDWNLLASSELLALCEGNPSVADGHFSQGASSAGFHVSFSVTEQATTNNKVATGFRNHCAHVTSLLWYRPHPSDSYFCYSLLWWWWCQSSLVPGWSTGQCLGTPRGMTSIPVWIQVLRMLT